MKLKSLLSVFAISVFSISGAFCIGAGDIYHADTQALDSMLALRGLEVEGGDDEKRRTLYEYEGLEAYYEDAGGLGSEYTVDIVSADYLGNSGDSVILKGNVELGLTYGGGTRKLKSDEVVIDPGERMLTALGDVSFIQDDGAGDIDADIVAFYWDKGSLYVENASTRSDKTNSEDEKVTVYSVGQKLTFLDNGAVLYEDGYIASEEEDPLSSISASKIMMLPGSDLLIENAVLKIGRVPIFYFPIFFYPGSVMNGNPSFGFNSAKGAFLNTTFEILGHTDRMDDGGSSSFLSIFESDEDRTKMVPDGPYYSSSAELSPAQKWASDTQSHIAVMADAYSLSGIHLGLDAKINLFDRKFSGSTYSGIGFSGPSSSRNGNLRYYSLNKVDYSDHGFTFSADIPFYSDNSVMYDLGNRLTGFSMDALFGLSQNFPTDYSSSISSFKRSIELSYRLPSSLRTNLLSSLTISDLDITSTHRWRRSGTVYSYVLEEVALPKFSASASGRLFGLETERLPDAGTGRNGVETDALDAFILSDPLLFPMYQPSVSQSHSNSGERYYFNYDYSISESLGNTYDFTNGVFDGRNLDNSLSARLTASIKLADYLEISHVLSPSHSYSLSEEEGRRVEESDFLLKNSLTVSIPYVGLTYKLSNTLFEYGRTDKNGTVTTKRSLFEFDKNHVGTHSLSLSRSIRTEAGVITPKLTYTLPPLTGSLTPEVAYSLPPFSVAMSYKFQDDGDGSYKSDLVKLSLGYNGTFFVTSWAFEYQSRDFRSSDILLPLSFTGQVGLRTADKRYSISGLVDYSVMSSSGTRNMFDSLKAVVAVPHLELSVDFTGPADGLELDSINTRVYVRNALFRAWKGRIYISLGLDSELELDVNDIGASSFTFEPSIIFSIAEFLDFRFSFTTVNNNFSDYEKDGSFSLPLLWEDLMRSLDFFGDGRRNTNFNLSSVSLEAVHYMQDWNLHCKYSASVVLSDSKYQFVPQFSIYLSWNTFPDLKIDENWKRRGDSWIRSDTN